MLEVENAYIPGFAPESSPHAAQQLKGAGLKITIHLCVSNQKDASYR